MMKVRIKLFKIFYNVMVALLLVIGNYYFLRRSPDLFEYKDVAMKHILAAALLTLAFLVVSQLALEYLQYEHFNRNDGK